MTTTTNLNLKKPEQSDGINIADINGNMDTLDLEIKELKDKFDPEGRAKDADRLGGKAAGDYALSGHNHSGVYAPTTHSHTPAEAGATPAAHATDGNIHVTAADKTNWNGKAAGDHNHNGVYSPVAHNHAGVYEPANGYIVKSNANTTMTAVLKANGATDLATDQVRNIMARTDDLTAGVTGLSTGIIYLVYE